MAALSLTMLMLLANAYLSHRNCITIGEVWNEIMTCGHPLEKGVLWSGFLLAGVGFSIPFFIGVSSIWSLLPLDDLHVESAPPHIQIWGGWGILLLLSVIAFFAIAGLQGREERVGKKPRAWSVSALEEFGPTFEEFGELFSRSIWGGLLLSACLGHIWALHVIYRTATDTNRIRRGTTATFAG